MTENNKYSLTLRIVIGMVAGILTGVLLKLVYGSDGDLAFSLLGLEISFKGFFTDGILHLGGQIFILSLKMLVVPLVFVSLVCGVTSLSDTSKLGRLGGKAIGLYLVTTAIAITLAITMALFISPGDDIRLTSDASFAANEAPALVEVLINMFPDNPFSAFATGNMLQVIVFALLFGIAVNLSGEAGSRITAMFEDLNVIIMKLVTILMNLAPYGVFCLLAKLFSTIEFGSILSLAEYFLVVLGVLLMHAFISYPVLLKVLSGLNPLIFLRKMRDAAIFAFSTSSSNATLPVTLETATKKLGVKNSIASFTVPLGATINMDGTAIMQGVATVFIAEVYGVDLVLADYLMVILTATLASVGTAGVPGVGLIMLAMVLQQVGLPTEGIGLIIGVDRLLDMTRTAVNITGDSMVTCVVAKSEGEIDTEVFADPDAAKDIERADFHHMKG